MCLCGRSGGPGGLCVRACVRAYAKRRGNSVPNFLRVDALPTRSRTCGACAFVCVNQTSGCARFTARTNFMLAVHTCVCTLTHAHAHTHTNRHTGNKLSPWQGSINHINLTSNVYIYIFGGQRKSRKGSAKYSGVRFL